MSGTTPNFGFHYGTIDDLVSGLMSIQQAMTDVDTYLAGAKVGAGALQHNAGIAITPGAGWGSIDYYWITRNGFLELTISATRSGSTVTANSAGGFVDVLAATLPAGKRPLMTKWGSFVGTAASGGALLDTDGTWTLTDAHPTATISSGDVVRSSFTYAI